MQHTYQIAPPHTLDTLRCARVSTSRAACVLLPVAHESFCAFWRTSDSGFPRSNWRSVVTLATTVSQRYRALQQAQALQWLPG
jgi:hypothetical protein